MKDMITTIAAIMLLMMFLLQFTANQVTFTKIMGAETAIKNFRLSAGNQGEIKSGDISELKEHIADILKCDDGEITVDIESEDQGGNLEVNTYSVSMPIRQVIGPSKILGLSSADNLIIHKSKGIIYYKKNVNPTEEEKKLQ